VKHPTPDFVPVVECTRGRLVESVHYGAFSAVRSDGTTLAALGDQRTKIFLRSSAKPFQALSFLEQGGAEVFKLEPHEVALLCASHSGTDEHVQALNALQSKIGIRESDLQCGTHPPYHRETAARMQVQGEPLTPNRHNCSGKHTGMLAFAQLLGAPKDNYLDPAHPVQRAILCTFAEMCGVAIDEIELGTDGCSAPVFAVPLPAAALAYARLCQPEGLPEQRAAACRLITRAMSEHGFMVAGPGRFDTVLMAEFGKRVIAKSGAEGYLGMGVLPGSARHQHSGIGIAIKIADGDASDRARCVVGLEMLCALGILQKKDLTILKPFASEKITNQRGLIVGEIRPSAALREALPG